MSEYKFENAWNTFVEAAIQAQSKNKTWLSPIKGNSYSIKEATKNRITIQRLKGGRDASFGETFYLNVLKEIFKNGYRSRRNPYGEVAEIATIVALSPELDWSKDQERIIIRKEEIIPVIFEKIPDDKLDDWQSFARKIRRHQGTFREELLKAYSFRCCITDINLDTVLDACHIVPHSISGINDIYNGIVLRTDLHNLFDKRLLFINPQTLEVVIDPSLSYTEYWQYNNKEISKMINGESAGKKYLEMAWRRKYS